LKPFFYLYYALSVLLYIAALPLLAVLVLKNKYKESLPARFFLFKNKKFSIKNGIWFHVCSLGEAKALNPLIEKLESEDVKITAITQTGFYEAKRYGKETRYLPFEIFLPFWMQKQRILVVLEAEFWYALFVLAFRRGTKVVLLNARISEKSVKRYMKMAWFYKRIFGCVDKVFCQSEIDAYRLETLGAKDIEIIGNIKLAQKIRFNKEYAKPKEISVVAASTHEGEEALILEAYKTFMHKGETKLFVVPRHPERFEAVFALLNDFAEQNALCLSRLTQTQSFDADIILVDMMGELNNIYNIGDIAIVGGSFFMGIGGHNPLEAAHFGCKIISGEHIHDQKELFKYVLHVQYVANAKELAEALKKSEQMPPSSVLQTIDIEPVVNYIQGSK
jgi:3-deoxy-D-manno-octulosonic-acid transferase